MLDEIDDDADVMRYDDRPAGMSDDRPEVWLTVETAILVDQSIAALRADPEIFVRGGALTRVIASDGSEGKLHRDVGAPVMRRAVAPWLTERLSVHARFMKKKTVRRGDETEQVPVQVSPPSTIAPFILARETWPGYRALSGVVTSPTMRSDGSVLQTPGYDARSGLVYIPRGTYAVAPDEPTRDQAIESLGRLLDVIGDFPLSDLARSGWLALLFTLCARELAEGSTPLFAIDAPVAGSGKGLLVRSAHIIAFGHDIAHMSLPPDEEEFRKQITTTLLSGDPAVLFDNVGVPIGGDAIESVITAPVWKVRKLGTNEDSGSLTPRIVTIASGNGLEFVGDMGRRTLRIRIDTAHEAPEERADYRDPERAGADKLLGWVRARRESLVVDALTVLRAWHVAGRPGTSKPWGSFESWSNTIAKCVQWITGDDPSLARATTDASVDPQRLALATVYDAIRRLAPLPLGITSGQLVRVAFPPPRDPPTSEGDLAEAISALAPNARDDATRARILGRKLKAGRILNGHQLIAVPGGARSVRYLVKPIPAVHEVKEVNAPQPYAREVGEPLHSAGTRGEIDSSLSLHAPDGASEDFASFVEREVLQ